MNNDQGKLDQNVKTNFQWKVLLTEEEKKRLFKERGTVETVAEVSLVRIDNSQNLWPIVEGKRNEWIIVGANPSGKNLKVSLSRRIKGRGRLVNEELYCKWNESMVGKNRKVYEASFDPVPRGNSVYLRVSIPLKTNVSLRACEWGNNRKTITCDLKVTDSFK